MACYRVYRKNADVTWSRIATVGASGHTHTALTNGTTYTYRVTALDTAGNESQPSAEFTATPADGTAPASSRVSRPARLPDPREEREGEVAG